jgi:hypothetical protein
MPSHELGIDPRNDECYDLSDMSTDNSNEAWTIPPELEQPLPRRVRLSFTGIAYCIMGAASIFIGLGLAYRLVHSELRREADNESLTRSLAAEGSETEATVTRLSTTVGHLVTYQYTVDGRSYSKGAFIATEHWQALKVGSALAIRYLPSDPAKSFPESDSPDSQTHWLVVVPASAFVLLLMFSFAYGQLSAVLPQRRLLADGRLARGVVTGCKRGSRGRRSGYFLSYAFSLADGTQCQGREFSGQPLAEKSPVAVLYDPDRPRRSAPYPMETARLATT